jgi:hypothetical protein
MVFSVALQVTADVGRLRGRSQSRSPLFLEFLAAAREPAAASNGGAWNNAPPLFLLSFGFTELVPALLWIFEWLFCNFRIV